MTDPVKALPAAAAQSVAPETASPLRRGIARFFKNRPAVFGLLLLIVLVVVTAGADLFAKHPPNEVDLGRTLLKPSAEHYFGTDNVGRDYFARTLHGGRVSLLIGFAAMLISIAVGTIIGAIAGYFGGMVDEVLSRFTDLILSLPLFYIMIVVFMLLQPGTTGVVVLIGLTSWMTVTRLVRGLFLKERQQDYVVAAQALGAPSSRIMWRHLLPNVLGPIIVTASFRVGDSILLESSLSFLGLGIQPPQATWGNMIIGAHTYLFNAPWIAIFPGVMITITVMAFMFVGDGLRDAFDSKLVSKK